MAHDTPVLTRRALLGRSAVLGCSLAASPLITPITLASTPWDARLVVIILRGGMDGIDVVRPIGDADFAAARPTLAGGGAAHDLDGYFALHPDLGGLMPMWRAGELGFAHAVSTPYRDRRSHFDGQDLLEAGTGFDVGDAGARDGWLNRMLQTMPGVEAQTAFAIGREQLMILSGDALASNWSPDTEFALSDATRDLLEMTYHEDAPFRDAMEEAILLAGTLGGDTDINSYAEALNSMQSTMRAARRGRNHLKIAEFAIDRLRADTRVAAFSLNGWDTHNNQARGIARALAELSEVLLALQSGLGGVWGKTTVLAMTEFGRTARENGSRGTDHGTGGAMVLAGGALRGGRVFGNWPGLNEAALYKGRDLMPTADVRDYAAAAMQGLFGIDRSALEGAIFPGLHMEHAPDIIR